MKPRLSHVVIACALAVAAHHARAESFLAAEVGLGMQQTADMGDGTWVQTSASIDHHEKLRSPAFLAGIGGELVAVGAWNLRYHANYVYFGQITASCTCVPDSAYNAKTHIASEPGYIPFNGTGHTQGVALTLDLGYTYRGWRLAAEAGPFIFWATWHESRLDPIYPTDTNLSHKTVPQLGWVIGARVERGNLGVSYRYYRTPQRWNPYPAIGTGTHMLMATWRF